jgi:hypothetical protein
VEEVDRKGALMDDVGSIAEENVIIPIYIFQNGNLVIVGEALIGKEKGKYYGAFDFDTPIDFGEKIEFPMNLVTGEKGQRSPVGIFEFRRHHGGTEYTGSIEFSDDLNLDVLMHYARSLINI